MMQSNLHHLDLLKVSFICSFALLYRFWTYLNLTIIIYICPFSKSYNLRTTFSKNYCADVLAKTCEISLMRHLFRMEGLEFFENHKLSVITYFVLFIYFGATVETVTIFSFVKNNIIGSLGLKTLCTVHQHCWCHMSIVSAKLAPRFLGTCTL